MRVRHPARGKPINMARPLCSMQRFGAASSTALTVRRVLTAMSLMLMWISALVMTFGVLFALWADEALGFKITCSAWVALFLFVVAWACLDD
jgi:hypothetical protein